MPDVRRRPSPQPSPAKGGRGGVGGAVAVLDVGKTNVKLALFDPAGAVLWERSVPNRPLPGPPYLHANVEAIWSFFVASLAEAAGIHPVETIVPTTHGAAASLVDDHGLAMPAIDYEETRVEEIERTYAKIRPPFTQSYSPSLAYGLNVGRQLAWQRAIDPEGFARARCLLFYPQYWAWRMTGIAATEATSIACHTDLWMPGEGRASDLVAALGLEGRVPPLTSAWASLGPPHPEFAAAAALGPEVRVLCGVHDSNASIIPYLAHWPAPFTVVSTGTWVILLGVGLPIGGLDPTADMLANLDITGRPTACARFMGGREYAEIAGSDLAPPTREAVQGLIDRRALALPAFSPQGGPFAHVRGRIVGEVAPGERGALATLYVAVMTDHMLTRLGAREGVVIVDGNLGANAAFGAVLAQFRDGQSVVSTRRPIGAAYGAAMLASWPNCPPLPELLTHESWGLAGLEEYRERWLAGALAGR
jgi:sugar (pentulose or hexulose) kinase